MSEIRGTLLDLLGYAAENDLSEIDIYDPRDQTVTTAYLGPKETPMTTVTTTRCDNCAADRPPVRRLCDEPWIRADSDGFGERDFCSLRCMAEWAEGEGEGGEG